jgi:hypothetical protein
MMRRQILLFAALVALCLGLTGCASLQDAMKCFPGKDSWPLCGL